MEVCVTFEVVGERTGKVVHGVCFCLWGRDVVVGRVVSGVGHVGSIVGRVRIENVVLMLVVCVFEVFDDVVRGVCGCVMCVCIDRGVYLARVCIRFVHTA